MKKFSVFIVLFFSLTHFNTAVAQTDTLEARTKLANEYFRILPMQKMMTDMAKEISKQLPPERRAEFEELIIKRVRIQHLENEAKKSLIKHLTQKELELYVEFIKRPEGRSAMDKMKYYMADLMPVIQVEIRSAIQDMQSGNKQKIKQ
ncbi:MAG: hypothetical protein OEZ39_17170 [Gammaproteobacteria bacterium]|nr:hypothetical protein [Gammaproteobacteria bacterium]MDH5653594.1 hypothetical protein [Gammaproteobacteria bacterium]